MAATGLDMRPLTLDDLAAHLATGCKAPSDFRVGSEHEKIVFRLGSYEPVRYEVDAEGRDALDIRAAGLGEMA